jgi:hypothetical protein
MKLILLTCVALIAVLPLATIDRAAAQAQCLHGPQEDAAQKTRRTSALRLVRAINTAEANEAWRTTNSFAPLANLSVDLHAAPGFESDFTTDGKTYALILHDKMDACGFVFSTNQNGVIFQGYPIDYDVQPISR